MMLTGISYSHSLVSNRRKVSNFSENSFFSSGSLVTLGSYLGYYYFVSCLYTNHSQSYINNRI